MSTDVNEVVIEGITKGFFAIAQPAQPGPFVAVHSDDGDLAFTLSTADWTAAQINAVIAVYEKAFGHGERYGEANAQRAFREAIGLGHL
ncbi:hypothetical protein [Burkholderia gladioli]|uniref:hypothetical protein n=1 Tax=Burkholderia gladioli TaxID=28095 RepID=UPI001641675F|nr:hypothetical protein [Burkholderia gladioli]